MTHPLLPLRHLKKKKPSSKFFRRFKNRYKQISIILNKFHICNMKIQHIFGDPRLIIERSFIVQTIIEVIIIIEMSFYRMLLSSKFKKQSFYLEKGYQGQSQADEASTEEKFNEEILTLLKPNETEVNIIFFKNNVCKRVLRSKRRAMYFH